MDPQQFFSVIAAVLIANSATAALIFGVIRLRKHDAWDKYSSGAIIYAGCIGMLAGYLAN